MAAFSPNRVVVPVDFSEDSCAAVDAALEMVSDPSYVTVIHVLPEHHVRNLLADAIDHAKHRNVVEDALRRCFDAPQYRLLKYEVAFGDPGHRVAELAQAMHADLIVMPSHGKTGLRRMLIGSVAERVVRLAHCPVLVLRKPHEPAQT